MHSPSPAPRLLKKTFKKFGVACFYGPVFHCMMLLEVTTQCACPTSRCVSKPRTRARLGMVVTKLQQGPGPPVTGLIGAVHTRHDLN